MKFASVFLWALAAASLVRVNDKNFKDVVLSSGKFTLVDFYADWCRHCMKLMPTIEQLAELYEDFPEVQIVKINGDEDGRKMTKKYKIPGFPTLLMFNGDSEPVEFDGMRDLDSISNFVQQVSGVRLKKEEEAFEYDGPSNIVAVNDDNFEKEVLRANHKTLVVFTAPWCKYCQQLKPVFSKLANAIFSEDSGIVKFAEVDVSDENKGHVAKVVGQFAISQMPTILFFDPHKTDADGLKRPVPYTEDRSLESLLNFVNENAGLSRDQDGQLTEEAGRIKHVDELLKDVTEDTKQTVLGVIEELKENVSQFGKDALVEKDQIWLRDDVSMLPYYSKLAVRIASGDFEYVKKELARLEKIVSKNARDLEKSARDYMQKRINVLRAFVGK